MKSGKKKKGACYRDIKIKTYKIKKMVKFCTSTLTEVFVKQQN